MDISDDQDLKEQLNQKAADLFRVCDKEDKGFVTKRDMQRMRSLDDSFAGGLDPDQLESVFDTLDEDGNGYLTLEEFSAGFQHFVGVPDGPESLGSGVVEEQLLQQIGYSSGYQTLSSQEKGPLTMNHDGASQPVLNTQQSVAFEYDDHFEQLLDELGIREVIGEDDEALRTMWNNLKLDPNPDMMAGFEAVLSRLTGDLEKKQAERRQMETAFHSRNKLQEEHLKQAYEEMELQMQKERDKIREEEERKYEKAQRDLEAKLNLKEMQLQEMINKQNTLEEKLNTVYKEVPEIKDENAHLLKERDLLQREVDRQKTLFKDMQDHMDEMRQQTKEERKQRAKAAFKVSENIAKERENLVHQLHHLKDVNKDMMDKKDIEALGGQSSKNDNADGENMGMFAHHFNGGNTAHEGATGNMDANNINGQLSGHHNNITNLNTQNDINKATDEKDHQDHQAYNNQVYISLQSPSREDNPITSFVKPPDFLSLKPLTQDEEKAILMQGKGRGEDMRRMREFAPIMSSPEHHEGIQNSNFPQTMGMDKSDCECDDAYFEQTIAAQNSDPIKTHPAGHHLVQTCPPNHAGESNSLIQNHQATIVSSANEHMMLAPTLSADDLINAVNRHRRLMRRHGSAQSQSSNISLLDEIAESFHTGVINQGTVSSLPLPVPENDAESALDEERSEKNDNDEDEFSCDDEHDDAEDSSIAELGSSAPSSGTHKYKRGSHLQSRPPLRRKRSLRNGRPRALPYGNTLNNQSNINGIDIAENVGRNGLSNAAHFSRRSTELGSVADESLTSCTGPMSQDESDFSSFNLNSASIGASTKNFKKDENLADELELAHQTHCSVPISKSKILPDANFENRKRERIESFTAEAQCDDHPPIIGTQENTVGGYEKLSPGFPTCAFKVIFVGDSSVGKTSIISRLCKNRFDPSVGATVGVDFQTRVIDVENTSICLQCWDTAGQERYRSLTRQYFRKSDAVVIVYDITNQRSFLNAREWITSAKEVISVDRNYSANEMDSIAFILVGNKLDLADDDSNRGVRKSDGLKLANQNSALFFEVSAADGRNIESAISEMATILKQNFDKDLERGKQNEDTILLDKHKKKKGCWC